MKTREGHKKEKNPRTQIKTHEVSKASDEGRKSKSAPDLINHNFDQQNNGKNEKNKVTEKQKHNFEDSVVEEMFEKRVFFPGFFQSRYLMILILVGQLADFCLDYYNAG